MRLASARSVRPELRARHRRGCDAQKRPHAYMRASGDFRAKLALCRASAMRLRCSLERCLPPGVRQQQNYLNTSRNHAWRRDLVTHVVWKAEPRSRCVNQELVPE